MILKSNISPILLYFEVVFVYSFYKQARRHLRHSHDFVPACLVRDQ